jgi:DNA-binding XRE family transcriptional regulator
MEEKMIPRLKLFRWKRGLTQKELAKKAGLPLWKIRGWESGKRVPSLVEMLRVQIVLKGNLFVFNPLELKEVQKKMKAA